MCCTYVKNIFKGKVTSQLLMDVLLAEAGAVCVLLSHCHPPAALLELGDLGQCQLALERDSMRVVTTTSLVCLLHSLWPEVRRSEPTTKNTNS